MAKANVQLLPDLKNAVNRGDSPIIIEDGRIAEAVHVFKNMSFSSQTRMALGILGPDFVILGILITLGNTVLWAIYNDYACKPDGRNVVLELK